MSELLSIKGSSVGSVGGSACEDTVFCAKLGRFGSLHAIFNFVCPMVIRYGYDELPLNRSMPLSPARRASDSRPYQGLENGL